MFWFGKAAMALASARRFKDTAERAVDAVGKAKEYWRQFAEMEFGTTYGYAKKGDRDAQFDIAERYYKGRGVEQNLEDAILWYQRAARAGHDRAQCTLAMLVFLGRGTSSDPVEAWKWMLLALQAHDQRAQELAPSLVKKLTQEQRWEGERLAEEFRPEETIIQDTEETPQNLDGSAPDPSQ